ncbi:MAG: hypothetical protein QNJ30_19330 [Kiloniellales bacterium]|nr:hypothetical protein [Kiloniellales bacterium]
MTRLTLYDGTAAVDIRVATGEDPEVLPQAERLRDDLNAFVATGDPFNVVITDSTAGDHIRVEIEQNWATGDADWELFTAADGVLYVRARSALWLTRAVARLSWSLGKRMWLPNSAFLVQPTYPTISVELDIAKAHDVQDTGAFGTAGGFLEGSLKTDFPEWQRVNMVGPVPAVISSHVWQGAVLELSTTPEGNPEWNSTDHYVDDGKRLQVYLQDENGSYVVCERFAEWLKQDMIDRGRDNVSVSTTDGTKGWEHVVGFGRDDGDPTTYNETEINLFLAKKVAESFAADADQAVRDAQISMLAYGSTSYPGAPGKLDPEGHGIFLPAGLHVVVTKGFFQGTEDWNSVHDSYRTLVASGNVHQFSGYWYMSVWQGSRDRPGAAAVSREDVLADWWANDAPRITENYPLYVGGELGAGLCPTFLGALIWQGIWRKRGSDLAGLARDVVTNFLDTCFPTGAVRSAMEGFTARALWIRSGSFAPLLTEDLLHRMYGDLVSALDANPTAEERARLNAFVKYTRFLELYRAVLAAEVETAAGLDVYDEFRAFLYHIRYEGLVTYHFWTWLDPFGADRDLEDRYGGHPLGSVQLEKPWGQVPSTWQSGGAYFPDFSDAGLYALCVAGLTNNNPYTFTVVGYPDDPFDGLVAPQPAAAAEEPNRPLGQAWYDRSDAVTLWVKTTAGQTSLDWWFKPWVTGSPGADQTVEVVDGSETVVDSRTFTAAQDSQVWTNWVATGLQENTVYQLRIKDPRKQGVWLCWWRDGDPGGASNEISGTYLVSFRVLPAETQAVLTGSPKWYFYVPAGATEVGGVWSKMEGEIRDATGTTILDKDPNDQNSDLEAFHLRTLTANQLDTVMRGVNVGGDLTLMTLPPYLALHPDELIVPPSAV